MDDKKCILCDNDRSVSYYCSRDCMRKIIRAHNYYNIYDTYAELEILKRDKTKKIVLVDVEDVKKLFYRTWFLNARGYVATRINDKLCFLGKYLTGEPTSYIDNNKLNNQKINLKKHSKSDTRNKNNPLGLKYIYQYKYGYFVRMKNYYGTFRTIENALIARNEQLLQNVKQSNSIISQN